MNRNPILTLPYVLLALIVLTAAYLASLQFSYWWDELFSATVATVDFGEWMRLLLADVHPPLYFLLLKGWVAVFGDSELATRSLSVIFAAGAGWVFIRNSSELATNKLEQVLPALLFLLAWPFLYYAVEARSNALLLLLSTLAFFRVHRQCFGLGTWALLILLSLTHYFGTLLALVWLAQSTLFALRQPHRLIAPVITGLAILVWPLVHFGFGDLGGRGGGSHWVNNIPFSAFVRFDDLFMPVGTIVRYVPELLIAAVTIAGMVALALLMWWRKFNRLALSLVALVLYLLAATALDTVKPLTTTRNLIGLLPMGSYLLVVASLRVLGGRWFSVPFVAVLALSLFSSYERLPQKIAPSEDIKSLFRHINGRYAPLYYYRNDSSLGPTMKLWVQKNYSFYSSHTLPEFTDCEADQVYYIVNVHRLELPEFSHCEYSVVQPEFSQARLIKATRKTASRAGDENEP